MHFRSVLIYWVLPCSCFLCDDHGAVVWVRPPTAYVGNFVPVWPCWEVEPSGRCGSRGHLREWMSAGTVGVGLFVGEWVPCQTPGLVPFSESRPLSTCVPDD